ncbi:MAG: hypothetical protein ACYS7Y_11560 [Planctomycetota bacterium]|jgi:DNA ligase-1
MARREFLQLAKTYKPDNPKMKIAGWLISEKLDGTRCFWDGGITRGMATVEVPFASVINPKTGEWKTKIKPKATGLWSRYGNPIIAPDWFLDKLPKCPLDGELWAGRGKFQTCRSICAGDTPDERFKDIRYMTYGMPSLELVFGEGEIKNSNFHCMVNQGVLDWAKGRQPAGYLNPAKENTFETEYEHLEAVLDRCDVAFAHRQVFLDENEEDAQEAIEEFLRGVLDLGGEGVIIRDPRAVWTPKRVNALLKYKPFFDAEGVITGFTSGRETDKGSKHLGKIGALILDFEGKRLELSGLTDEERLFATDEMEEVAREMPGMDMGGPNGPSDWQGKHFKVGQTVTFKYRELSDDGIPKEARYWRKRDVE